jgi:hypothetical protein
MCVRERARTRVCTRAPVIAQRGEMLEPYIPEYRSVRRVAPALSYSTTQTPCSDQSCETAAQACVRCMLLLMRMHAGWIFIWRSAERAVRPKFRFICWCSYSSVSARLDDDAALGNKTHRAKRASSLREKRLLITGHKECRDQCFLGKQSYIWSLMNSIGQMFPMK